MTIGRWRRRSGPDLVVVADRPGAAKPSLLLGEALDALATLLDRATRATRATRERADDR